MSLILAGSISLDSTLNPKKISWSSYPLAFSSGLTIPIPSVADPWHFGVDPDLDSADPDPDPRIHASD